MSKLTSSHCRFSREFKLEAVRRVLAGEKVSVVARDLKLPRNDLYVWRDRFLAGGPEAMRDRGRPRNAERLLAMRGGAPPPQTATGKLDREHGRNAELERKVGQQQLELDFFRQALRQVAGARRPSAGLGVTESTRSSKR